MIVEVDIERVDLARDLGADIDLVARGERAGGADRDGQIGAGDGLGRVGGGRWPAESGPQANQGGDDAAGDPQPLGPGKSRDGDRADAQPGGEILVLICVRQGRLTPKPRRQVVIRPGPRNLGPTFL